MEIAPENSELARANIQEYSDKKFSFFLQKPAIRQMINATVKDSPSFITGLISAISANPKLNDCEPASILSAGLLGAALKLSPSPQLGQYYIVPFGRKAQFIVGYKGLIQLAIRTSAYRKMTFLAIKEGELKSWNPLEETLEAEIIIDDRRRNSLSTSGYYGMLEYMNGFRKAMFWSYDKMILHADTYVLPFSARQYEKVKQEKGHFNGSQFSSYWYKNFDEMGLKTIIRQLITKWGAVSVDFQRAVVADGNPINPDLTPDVSEVLENTENSIPEVPAIETEAPKAIEATKEANPETVAPAEEEDPFL